MTFGMSTGTKVLSILRIGRCAFGLHVLVCDGTWLLLLNNVTQIQLVL
jgi:hypothetical protein